jgi:hypothetical protein
MKNAKASCLTWTAVFLTLAAASGWFVHRRAPDPSSTIFGGFAGGAILVIAFAWWSSIPERAADWLRIVAARFGSEPRDGKRTAIIGTLRGHGELTAPFTRERCVLYAYEMTSAYQNGKTSGVRVAYEGLSMVPLSIEHGIERTRILAKPELAMKARRPNDQSARTYAKRLVDDTKFTPATKDEKDLSHGDGHLRYDYSRTPIEKNIGACTLSEKTLVAGSTVCAFGQYSADRRALLAPVTLRAGGAFGIGAAWRVVNAAVAGAAFAAIAVVAAAIFCVNFPLEAAEQARPERTVQWWEIDLERFVDHRIRRPLHEAGMLTSSGFYLQEVCEGCAKGRLEMNGRTIELKHATYVGGKSIHLSAKPGDRDGVTLNGHAVVLTINGKSAGVPASWLQENDIETSLGSEGEYQGRVTVIAPDGWIRCRVSFNTRVDDNAWLTR